MRKVRLVNQKFLCVVLEVIEEGTVNLYEYSEKINNYFDIDPEDQMFFYQGKRVIEVIINQDLDSEIQVFDASSYSLKKANIILHKYPNGCIYRLFYYDSDSVEEGLKKLIDLYNLSQKFNKDFCVGNKDFSQILRMPMNTINDLHFNFSTKTETIKIIFENKNYTYEAKPKIKIEKLIPKLKLFLNIFDGELIIKDSFENQCSSTKRLSEILSTTYDKTFYCELHNRVSTKIGLFKIFWCQHGICKSHEQINEECLGLGIFDLKKIFYNTECSNCNNFPKIEFKSIKCELFVNYQIKGQEFDYDQSKFINFDPYLWKFFTCICL